MSDTKYPVTPNFARVHDWNTAAAIYEHGSLIQQSLKLFRHLGDISEGVQKMNNLSVASGLGNLIVSTVGMVGFAFVTPERLGELYDESGARRGSAMTAYEVNALVRTVVDVVKAVDAMGRRPEDDICVGIAEYQLTEMFARIKGIASRSGLVIDRCIENATNVLCKKKGAMGELGIFHAFNDMPKVEPSGYVLAVYIESGTSSLIAEIIAPHIHSMFPSQRLGEFQHNVNAGVAELMNKHLAYRVEFAPLLKDRNPTIDLSWVVTPEGGALSTKGNDDFNFIIKALKKDIMP